MSPGQRGEVTSSREIVPRLAVMVRRVEERYSDAFHAFIGQNLIREHVYVHRATCTPEAGCVQAYRVVDARGV